VDQIKPKSKRVSVIENILSEHYYDSRYKGQDEVDIDACIDNLISDIAQFCFYNGIDSAVIRGPSDEVH